MGSVTGGSWFMVAAARRTFRCVVALLLERATAEVAVALRLAGAVTVTVVTGTLWWVAGAAGGLDGVSSPARATAVPMPLPITSTAAALADAAAAFRLIFMAGTVRRRGGLVERACDYVRTSRAVRAKCRS